jgi:hypothetical protein
MDVEFLKYIPRWEWPEDAGKRFLEILTDDRADDSERLLAAELAGDLTVINEELVTALLSILQDSDASDELRGKAAISLGPILEHADMMGFDDPDDLPITESTFHRIQESLRELYTNCDIPKLVRRRILEASVRASRDWHEDAVRTAYSSDEEDWKLTAVFSMRWVRGFDDQIVEALESGNEDVQYEAACAAGRWEVDAAWPYVSRLIASKNTDKPLLLAAIDAVAAIRPEEAGLLLVDLSDSEDEDIVDAATEAMVRAEKSFEDELDYDEDDDVFL